MDICVGLVDLVATFFSFDCGYLRDSSGSDFSGEGSPAQANAKPYGRWEVRSGWRTWSNIVDVM